MEKKKYQLPKEFAQKWVDALRSGEYGQTTGKLFAEGTCSYCCIGVAGHVLGVSNARLLKGNTNKLTAYAFEDVFKSDPLPHGLQAELIIMNDDDGKNFTEIADWIEENVEFV